MYHLQWEHKINVLRADPPGPDDLAHRDTSVGVIVHPHDHRGQHQRGPGRRPARGQRLGRPAVMTPEKVAYALHLLSEPDRSMSSIAELLGVSPSTSTRTCPECCPRSAVQPPLS